MVVDRFVDGSSPRKKRGTAMVRVKSRYLLCEINVTDRTRLLLLDDRAVAAARCYRLLWSALPFITCIETRGQKIPCFLNCLHVGGTIRTCQKFLIRYNTQQLHRMIPKCKNEEEKQEIQKAILNCTLTRGNKVEFEDELESEEDDDDEEEEEEEEE
ncbi:hypothetical protein F7725_012767 [Dissostichus mawsoni]|uniref:Uncharacterized protein n=1 Tax=Dissostichus mawsoni TaxID=36200 RepID=A0A7J5YNL0_DISMA|nr:hypothetical protein F7725_012767 [Dissostichus mawsoni]